MGSSETVRLKLTPSLKNEWDVRSIEGVITALEVIDWRSSTTIEVSAAIAAEIKADCEHYVDPKAVDATAGERSTYRAMLRQIDRSMEELAAASSAFVLAPMEPTEAMIHAAQDLPAPRMFGAVYRAMLTAAPKVEQMRGTCKKAVSQMDRAELQVEVFTLRAALDAAVNSHDQLVAALREALAVIDDYLTYEHNGDPWTEDARAMGEMDIDDYSRDGRLDAARAALAAAGA